MIDEQDLEQFRRNLGRNVRRVRRSKGMTQESLADAIKVSRGHVNRIECGKVSISAEVFCSLADALDVTLDFLRSTPLTPVDTM